MTAEQVSNSSRTFLKAGNVPTRDGKGSKRPNPCTYFSPTRCQHATPITVLLLDARATTAGDIARRPMTSAGSTQGGPGDPAKTW